MGSKKLPQSAQSADSPLLVEGAFVYSSGRNMQAQ